MSDNVSYTPDEIATILKISRYTVYEMIKRGELQAYRIGRKMRIDDKDLQEYILKRKGIQSTPKDQQLEEPSTQTIVPKNKGFIICGQDVVLDILARHLDNQFTNLPILRKYVGSMNGLLAMYHGNANIATGHLWAADVDEYNVPYVQRLLPGVNSVVINLVSRMAGFYVAKGNPKEIQNWTDLVRQDIRFVNREKGCGARVLLDEQLKLQTIDRKRINGYNQEELSHLAIASAVARGEADVGVGIEKVALQVNDIEFIPMQKERYDLIIRKEDFEKPHFQQLLTVIRSKAFKQEVLGMGHYDVSRMGEIIAEV
ncbi:helix-turn-helix transcriptional regulator [Halalkalibacter krulwichiae]|uniref:Thiosulfate transporter subunit n=1 Tax=Halalkalibacter krulwichiae TaxID=199441 RepID=A0A1X9ML61_9BACI|nr:helix-turn-helix transcriptional regulator [Halalkalibacter krulwichiae]ARK32531.1 thiosulfate transporter subunit [Halalkalibacter krulwichiae]